MRRRTHPRHCMNGGMRGNSSTGLPLAGRPPSRVAHGGSPRHGRFGFSSSNSTRQPSSKVGQPIHDQVEPLLCQSGESVDETALAPVVRQREFVPNLRLRHPLDELTNRVQKAVALLLVGCQRALASIMNRHPSGCRASMWMLRSRPHATGTPNPCASRCSFTAAFTTSSGTFKLRTRTGMSVPVVRIAGGAGDLSSSTRAVTIFPSGPVWRLSRPCDSSRVAVWLMDWRPAYVESLREDVVVERTVLDRLKRRSAMVGIRTSRRT